MKGRLPGAALAKMLPPLVILACVALLPGAARAQRYQAVLTEGGRNQVVGVVNLDGEKRVHVVSARPGRMALLQQLAAETNAEDVLQLDAAPPPGAPRFADVGKPVPRSDPRFLDALRLHLQRYYDLSLR